MVAFFFFPFLSNPFDLFLHPRQLLCAQTQLIGLHFELV